MGIFDGTRNAHSGATGKHGGPGRACSIARAVLVDVPRRLVGQELVVLDGARAGLAAHVLSLLKDTARKMTISSLALDCTGLVSLCGL